MSQGGPIRILRIIARLNIGGPAIQAVTLSRAFSEGSYRTLLVCGQVGAHEGDMSYLADSKGVRPLFLPSLGREISLAADARSFIHVREVIRRFKPHIVHTHTAKAGTVGRLAGLSLNSLKESRQRIRLVHTFHGHVFRDYFSPLRTRVLIEIERLLARFTDRIVAISASQEKDICHTYRIAAPAKVRVVPLGFDLSPYPMESAPQNSDHQRPYVVGIIGRLTHIKNHRLLVEAARDLRNLAGDRDFRFLVIGDGELREALVQYTKDLEVDKAFVFTGWKREMPCIYKMLDAVVLTSLNEGTPVTLIEAMAAGKPVIATDVGGVKDLLGPIDTRSNDGYSLAQRGIMVPSGKRDGLAAALIFALKNKPRLTHIAKQARTYVLREYSLERLTRNLDALYRELMSGVWDVG
jgi:glycosyltransferase involved in cell wall biosynthesis